MLNTSKEVAGLLLEGKRLTWVDPDNTKSEKIILEKASQRSVLHYLLNSPARDAANLPDTFVVGIKEAYESQVDPAATMQEFAVLEDIKYTWKLQKIETYGFGGINLFQGKEFCYEPDAQSVCLEGENGSGKSSLIAAIQWALTGDIIKDKLEPAKIEPEAALSVDGNKNIGMWPSIAAYPQEVSDLAKQPTVWVRLTFKDDKTSEVAIAERRLENGAISGKVDPRIEKYSALYEPAVLMASRLPHIDLSDRATTLVEAIQKLTGLDPLAELGDFVSGQGLGHSARHFLKYAKSQDIEIKKRDYELSLNTAHQALYNALQQDDYKILTYIEKINSKELEENLEELKKSLSQKVVEKLAILAKELPKNYKPEENAKEIREAVSYLRGRLTKEIKQILPNATRLGTIKEKANDVQRKLIKDQIANTEKQVIEAISWHKKQEADRKLRLKLLAAQYHLEVSGEEDITTCPLCDTSLADKKALAEELTNLKQAKEEAQKKLADRVSEISKSLSLIVPEPISGQLKTYAKIEPKTSFINDLTQNVLEDDNVKTLLSGVENFTKEVLNQASATLPDFSYVSPPKEKFWGEYNQLTELAESVDLLHRLCSLAEWWEQNREVYINFWMGASGQLDSDTKKYPADSIQGKLAILDGALEQAKPFETGLAQITAAIKFALEWQQINKEQTIREAIVADLKPLGKLRKYVEAKSKEAINSLSEDISKIFSNVCLTEKLNYSDTKIHKKDILVLGQLSKNYKIDARLVANASWMRAILWSFVFALRNATITKIGYNPFPLIVLDDPQATFDTKHRRKWAELISNLSHWENEKQHAAQFFITSHDMQFVNCVLTLKKFQGAFGLLSFANPATKVLVVADGNKVERLWHKAEETKAQSDGFAYVQYMRIYVETLIKIILHGESSEIDNKTLGELRDLLIQYKSKGVHPFDRPQFEHLINHTENGIESIKLLHKTHHEDKGDIGFAEAKDVKLYWDKKLKGAIENAFDLYREYRLINGEPRALFASTPVIEFPDGHKGLLAANNLTLRGKVAALTEGRACDGCFTVYEDSVQEQIKLYNHAAYRVTANTLEPVASYGDIILVSNYEKINEDHHNLVVTAINDKLVARRYEKVKEHPELVALVSQAINPKDLKPPHVVHALSILPSTKKIVGVLYGNKINIIEPTENEIMPINGEQTLTKLLSDAHIFEVKGRSAEPYALDGQYLIVGKPEAELSQIIKRDGEYVLAVDDSGKNYFKRLRVFEKGELIMLESLDISGREQSLPFSNVEGSKFPRITQISPVKGVIFNLPGTQAKVQTLVA